MDDPPAQPFIPVPNAFAGVMMRIKTGLGNFPKPRNVYGAPEFSQIASYLAPPLILKSR